MTEKSVEARKAFERFVEAAQKASSQAEGTAHSLQSSAKDVSARAISFTDAKVPPAFDLAQKLVHAKDPQELLAHQSEYVKMQLRRYREAGEGAGRRCPDGSAAEKAIPSLHFKSSGLGIRLPIFRHQAWGGLSAEGRPIGKYRQ